MSDFLARMAGRALGSLPLAQPLIPSTFASGATPEPVVAETAVQPEAGPAQPRVTQPLPLGERVPEARETAGRIPKPQAQPVIPAVTVAREAPPSVPQHDQSRHAGVAAPLVAALPHESSPIARVELHETLPGLLSPRPSPAVMAPAARRPEPPRHAAGASPEPAPPVIRVTIGRVDVRAEFPPAAAPRSQPARRAAPALSLDDYLKQRSEGKR